MTSDARSTEAPSQDRPLVLNGKTIATAMRQEVGERVEQLVAQGGRRPKLVAVLVGEDPASQTYVASKAKACKAAGMDGETLILPADTDDATLRGHLQRLNDDDGVDGILLQLPLPDHLEERPLLEMIRPEKDVDGFHPENVGRLWLDQDALTPATPTGVIELLERYDIDLKGKHAVIIGRSHIVGKPMAALLLRKNCTVTICHSRTHDLVAECRRADILVAAIGRPGFVTPDHVKEGAVVIDVGINRLTERSEVEALFPGHTKRLEGFDKRGSSVVGDVDYHRVAPISSAITPVPGGVGRLTVAQLLVNTLRASVRRQGLQLEGL